jgi:hypothetical protein
VLLADDELSTSERAELDKLRRQAQGRGVRGWRWVGAVALFVVASLLFMTSVVAVYVRSQVLNTDRYVETVAPLARDPAVQDAITNRLTDEFMTKLDIAGLTQQLADALKARGVPDVVTQLVSPIVGGVRSFISGEIHKVVTSDRFAQFWDSANRTAHEELSAVLTTGKGQFLSAQGTQVSLNAGALLTMVKQRLVDAGFGLAAKVPDTSITIPLFESDQLPRIRTAASLLNTLAWVLPLVSLLLLLAGVLAAPNRRRGLLVGSIAFAVGLLLLLGALTAARTYYLNHLPDTVQSPDAVRVLYDTETRFLIKAIQTLTVLFAITALACLVFGPSRLAVGLRRLVDRALDAGGRAIARTGVPLGPVPAFLRQQRRPIAVGVVVLAVAILIIWQTPGIAGLLWLTVGVLALLAIIELIARAESHPAAAVAAQPTPG